MSEFVYESSAWHNRATIAREAGVELGELGQSLGKVISRNYFGVGCQEGEALFTKLRTLLDEAVGDLSSIAAQATQLSSTASAARAGLLSADESGSAVFPR